MMRQIDASAVPLAKAKNMSVEELRGKYITGRLVDRDDKVDYGTRWEQLRKEVCSK